MDPFIEKELIDMRNDCELKPSDKRHENKEFLLQSIIAEKFTALWKKHLLFVAFSSLHIVKVVLVWFTCF